MALTKIILLLSVWFIVNGELESIISKTYEMRENLDSSLHLTKRQQQVDGNFGRWNSWSVCSVTCGGGSKIRTRVCNNPLGCSGNSSQTNACYYDVPCIKIDYEHLNYLTNFTTTCQNGARPFSCRLTLSKPYKISKLIFLERFRHQKRVMMKAFITMSDFPIYEAHEMSTNINPCSTKYVKRNEYILIQCPHVKIGQYVHIFFFNVNSVRINGQNTLIAAVDKDEESYGNFDSKYDPKTIQYGISTVTYKFLSPTLIALLQFFIFGDPYFGNIKVYAKDYAKMRIVNDVNFNGVSLANVYAHCLTQEIIYVFKPSKERSLLSMKVMVHTNRYHNFDPHFPFKLHYQGNSQLTMTVSLYIINESLFPQKLNARRFMISLGNELDIAFVRFGTTDLKKDIDIGITVENMTRFETNMTRLSFKKSYIHGNINGNGGVLFGRAKYIMWSVSETFRLNGIYEYFEIFAERYVPLDPNTDIDRDVISISRKNLNLTQIYQEDMSHITINPNTPFTLQVFFKSSYFITSVKLHTSLKISENSVNVKDCHMTSNEAVHMADFHCSANIPTIFIKLTFKGFRTGIQIIRLKFYIKRDDYPTITTYSTENNLHKISCEANHPANAARGNIVDNRSRKFPLKTRNGYRKFSAYAFYGNVDRDPAKVVCLIDQYLSPTVIILPQCNYGNLSHFQNKLSNGTTQFSCDFNKKPCSLAPEIMKSFEIQENSTTETCDYLLKPRTYFEGFLYCYTENSGQVLLTNKVYFIHKLNHWSFDHSIKIEAEFIDQSFSSSKWSILQRSASFAIDDTKTKVGTSSRTIVQDHPEWTAYLSAVCVDAKVGIDYRQFSYQFKKVKVHGRQDNSFIDCEFMTDTYQCGRTNPVDLIKILLNEKQTALILPNVEVECGHKRKDIELSEEEFEFVNSTSKQCGRTIELQHVAYIHQVSVRSRITKFTVDLEHNGNIAYFNKPMRTHGNSVFQSQYSKKIIVKPHSRKLYPAKFIHFRTNDLSDNFCHVRIYADTTYEPFHTTVEHSSPIKSDELLQYTFRILDLINTALYDEVLTTCVEHNYSSMILNLFQVVTLINVKLFHKPIRIINVYFNVISKYIHDNKTISDYDCGSFYGNVYHTNDPGWMNIFCHRRSVIALKINSDNSQWSLCEIELYGFYESNLLTVDKKDAVLSSAHSLKENRAENCIDFDLATKCQSSTEDPRINPLVYNHFADMFHQWLQLDLLSVKYIHMVFIIDEKLPKSSINYNVQVSEFTEHFQSYEYKHIHSERMIFTILQQGQYIRIVNNEYTEIMLNDVLVFGIDHSTVKLNSITTQSSTFTCLSDKLIFNKKCFSIGTRNTNLEIQFQKTELALVVMFVSYEVTEADEGITIKFFNANYPSKCPSWYSKVLSSRISLKCEIVTERLEIEFENPSFSNVEFHEIVLYAFLNTIRVRKYSGTDHHIINSRSYEFDPIMNEVDYILSTDEFYAGDSALPRIDNEFYQLYQYGQFYEIVFNQTMNIYSVRVIVNETFDYYFYRNPYHFRISGLNQYQQLKACAYFPYQVSIGLVVHLKCDLSTRVLRLTAFESNVDLENVVLEIFEKL